MIKVSFFSPSPLNVYRLALGDLKDIIDDFFFQDMEKWAKTLNAQKEAQKDVFKKNFTPIGNTESAVADVGFAVLEKSVSICVLKSGQNGYQVCPCGSNW